MKELYADHIVSVEAVAHPDGTFETAGKVAVIQKSTDWAGAHEIHSPSTEGPFVADGKFAVVFDFDVTAKATGTRSALREIAVYKVEGGKIVHEEFLYAAGDGDLVR